VKFKDSAKSDSKILKWVVPLVALMMLMVTLIPADVWHHPVNDAVYSGFDPNLIYTSNIRDPSSNANINVSKDSLELTAVTNSEPTADLVTSPMSFVADMSVKVLESETDTTPLELSIWTPYGNDGMSIIFGSLPSNQIIAQTLVNGSVSRTETLGAYLPGSQYTVEMISDQQGKTVSAKISGNDSTPSGDPFVRLTGLSTPEYQSQIFNDTPVAVEPGVEYSFGGTVRLVDGLAPAGFILEWLDKDGNRIDLNGEWNDINDPNGWTKVEYTAVAPPQAAFVRYYFGASPGVTIDFATLFLYETTNPQSNLLTNGDFVQGNEHWLRGSGTTDPLNVIYSQPVTYEYSVTAAELPQLFASQRLTLSVSAISTSGTSITVIDNYSLTLPHERWIADKVDDNRVNILVGVLLVLGALLCLAVIIRWSWPRIGKYGDIWRNRKPKEWLSSKFTIQRWPLFAGLGIALIVYLVANLLLFRISSSNADIITARIWTYITAHYGISGLYFRTNTVPLAQAWNGGLPFQEAGFPYDPTMAYVFEIIGWVYRIFFAPLGFGLANAGQIEWLVRFFNMLFVLGDSVIIYAILKEQKVSLKWSLIGAGLFMFNPAVWATGSVWGETQSISIFFLLVTIFMNQKGHLFWSWLFLILAAFSRIQMLVPALLIGIYLLKSHSLKENIRAISYSIVVMFLLLGPLSLQIGPTLWVDVILNALRLHVASGNGVWATLVSWNALSIWPMVTLLVSGQTGVNRIFYPATNKLVGSITYLQMGTYLFVGIIMVAVALIWFSRRLTVKPDSYLMMVALGTMGLFMLNTGSPAYHFIPVIALVILLRKSMSNSEYFTVVGILTFTTAVALYSVGVFWLQSDPLLGVGLFNATNPIVAFMGKVMTWNWFITLGSLANLFVMIFLFIKAIFPDRAKLTNVNLPTGRRP